MIARPSGRGPHVGAPASRLQRRLQLQEPAAREEPCLPWHVGCCLDLDVERFKNYLPHIR